MAERLPDGQFILTVCKALDEAIRYVTMDRVEEAYSIIKQNADTLLAVSLFYEDKELYSAALQFYSLINDGSIY